MSSKYSIVSLKFSPGLFKEMLVLQKQLENCDKEVSLLISKHYEQMAKSEETTYLGKSKSFKEIIFDLLLFPKILWGFRKYLQSKYSKENNHYILFYNSHPLNLIVQLYTKLFYKKIQIVTCLHEPYVPKEERKQFGRVRAIYISFILFLQKLSITVSNRIVTFSPHSTSLFKKHFIKHKHKLIQSNLLIENPPIAKTNQPRKYFSMIGTINKNKALDDLIKAVNYLVEHGGYDLKFKLVTGSNVEEYTKELKQGWERYFEVRSNSFLTDEEINEAIRTSYGVVILHTTASQSGVMPLASSFSTPILCRKITAFEQFQKNEENLLSVNFAPKEFLEKCQNIKNKNEYFIKKSKALFDKYFSENNFKEFYKDILN